MCILLLQHISVGTSHIFMWLVATTLESAGLGYVFRRIAFIERVGMTCPDIEGED